jgi:hypothetical protein
MLCSSCGAENDKAADICFTCGRGLTGPTLGSVVASRYEIVSALGVRVMKVTRIAVATVVVAGIATSALAVNKGKAKFIGATFEVARLGEKKDYPIDLKAEDRLVYADGAVEIPWASMEDVEYGQKVGHRIGTAILLSPLALQEGTPSLRDDCLR